MRHFYLMLKTIKYPIGIQTFSEIIGGGYLYVDKTAGVYKLANKSKYVFLSRPRRFGKSLLLSTLQSYFEGKKDLFEGLAICEHEKDWNNHPVLRFDLSAASYEHPKVLENKICSYLEEYEKIYGDSGSPEIGDRFRRLITAAHMQHGNKVVVLIDEYDKPLLDTLHDTSIHDTIKSRLRGFYAVLKECDEHIRFAMLTGVTKFAKVSVFSGLNNLKDISLLPEYNDICGITEQEFHIYFQASLNDFAQANCITVSEAADAFKSYYDGYHFARKGADIYNPFSTLNAFADNELGGYWFASGSPSYLIKLIERNQYTLDVLDGALRTKEELSDLTDTSRDIVPLLYQSGYLTIKGYEELTESYILGFPNKEVSNGFWRSLANHFFRPSANASEFNLQNFIRDLALGNAEEFMIRMRSLFAMLGSESESQKEVHFQNIMTIFINMLGFKATTEVHSSQGRSDVEIQTPQYIYILELKVGKSAEEALAQIHNKGYADKYGADPREKILIGINLSPTTRTVSDWKINRVK